MRRAVAAGAVALLATGCGTTVSTTTSAGRGGQVGTTTGLGAGPAGTSPSGGVGGSLPGAVGSIGSSGANAAGRPVTGTGGAAGTHAIQGNNGRTIVVGPGVTATTVKIGIPYATDVAAADQATGAGALNPGNTKAEAQAIWGWVNQHGGVGGRKAVLDFYGIPATTSDANSSFQAACDHFTQDSHDFVVLNKGTANFDACLEQRGALHLVDDLTISSNSSARTLPHDIRPAGITLEDSARTLVQGLNQLGYFSGAAVKVGIMSFDDPGFRAAINNVMLPALKAAGHPVASGDVQLAPPPNSVADYGPMDRAATNAAVHFRTDGVNHVLLFDSDGALTQGFATAAESQHAHFDYGVNSQNGMQVGLEAGDVPPDQAVGSMGVGWLPDFDVVASQRPANASAKKCRAIMAAAGFPASGDNADVIQLFMCQDAFTLQAAMSRLTGDITRDTVVAALQSLGPNLPDVANYVIGLDRQHVDGVRELRLYAYNQGCGCYEYRPGTLRA
jgi:hypothetical protein